MEKKAVSRIAEAKRQICVIPISNFVMSVLRYRALYHLYKKFLYQNMI
jgi:hypothetical protein